MYPSLYDAFMRHEEAVPTFSLVSTAPRCHIKTREQPCAGRSYANSITCLSPRAEAAASMAWGNSSMV